MSQSHQSCQLHQSPQPHQPLQYQQLFQVSKHLQPHRPLQFLRRLKPRSSSYTCIVQSKRYLSTLVKTEILYYCYYNNYPNTITAAPSTTTATTIIRLLQPKLLLESLPWHGESFFSYPYYKNTIFLSAFHTKKQLKI